MAIRTIKRMVDSPQKEALAYAAITPGHLIERMSGGKIRVHANAGQNAQRLFAIEDSLQGKEISEDYSADNDVRFIACRRGDEVNAILADGENAVIGSFLESNGNGELKVHAAGASGAIIEYPEAIVGQALEAVNASATGVAVADRRIGIEIV